MDARVLPLALSVALAGCFSPSVSTGSAGGTDSANETETSSSTVNPTDGSSTTGITGMTGSPTTTMADTDTSVDADSSTNDTSSMDAPPIIESFAVNGSTTPAEMGEGGMILLEVEAIDDLGITMVEFFDGDVSIGVVNREPYEWQQLVTSADTGSHTYRAVVTDTGDQTDESEVVTLSVNVVGGEVEFLRQQLFVGSDTIAVINGGVNNASPDRVFLGAKSDANNGHIMAFTPELSQIWSHAVPRSVSSAPIITDGALWSPQTNTSTLRYEYHRLSPETGVTIDIVQFDTEAEDSNDLIIGGAFATSVGNGCLLRSSLLSVAFYDSELEQLKGQLGGASAPPKIVNDDGTGFIATIGGGSGNGDCSQDAVFCARRYQDDGEVQWTAGLDDVSQPRFAAPDGHGGAFAVGRLASGSSGGDGFRVFAIDHRGVLTAQSHLEPGTDYYISDIAADGQGGFVVSGEEGGYSTGNAFVARYDSGFDEIRRQDTIISGTDSFAASLDVSGSAVYVYGLEDLSPDFVAITGDAWLARITL